tara:strand:- start:528 stop:3572 length:3045 start_codon:yes stop_codon:yes gene_type:complete
MADDRQFKFVSPGIFVNEIDNSQPPGLPAAIGPVIIGRFERGPSLRPVKVHTFAQFVEQFGNPIPGKVGGDVWRDSNKIAPTYAAYAAQAWLRSTPAATIVRLLGRSHNDASAGHPSEAGWKVEASGKQISATQGTNAGAYGLFVCQSGSAAAEVSGTLAAVFYLKEGSIELSGTTHAGSALTGAAVAVRNVAEGHGFRVLLRNGAGTLVEDVIVNFDVDNKRYIRERLNTNPTLLNSNVSTDAKTYFLGETFERNLVDVVGTSNAAYSDGVGGSYAFVMALQAKSDDLSADLPLGNNLRNTQPARSGWVIAQDLTSNTDGFAARDQQKLFRLESLDDGEWGQNNLKVSIEDIKRSTNKSDPYGSFTVSVRRLNDKDGAPVYVERFSGCSLNPNSPNYIAKKIGDQYYDWSETERRWAVKGNYPAASRFLRVKMNADVDDGATDPKLLPFGFIGAPRLLGFSLNHAASACGINYFRTNSGADDFKMVVGNAGIPHSQGDANEAIKTTGGAAKMHIVFPKHALREESKDVSLSDPTKTYWGLDISRKKLTDGTFTKEFDQSNKDLAHAFAAASGDIIYSYAPNGVDAADNTDVSANQPDAEATDILARANDSTAVGGNDAQEQTSDVFTLDDLKANGTTHCTWQQGSRRAGTSYTATAKSYEEVLDKGFDRFTMPLFGGADGLDKLEQEPFRNSSVTNSISANAPLSGRTELTSYAFNSVKMAIDSCADPDVLEGNAMVMPGITNPDLTDHLLEVCEGRADMLAIMDLEGGYVPSTEGLSESLGSVTDTVNNLRGRGINSSYGCAYFPWVQIQDTVNNATLWAPPSIAALGVFSSTDRDEELWFAPAGFTRGGLSENAAAGIPVVGVRQRLNSKERDKLYEANINPIAQFPAEGIVIFGQKTLQVTPSALDRINVRRLMIFLKREISKLAATTLFDQNVKATWNRFKGPAELLLASVKARYGLSAYKLVLDESTTTPELIERNIMYAKVLLAPQKAIEFIALDFVITRSGASFAD